MAAYKVEITTEDIMNATTFTSLSAKEVLTRSVAAFCIELVEVQDGDEVLPPMYRENRKLRQ